MSAHISPGKIAAIVAAATVTGAGTTAGVRELASSSSHTVHLAAVPRAYAALTWQQKSLVRSAIRVGPASHTVYVWGGTSRYGFDCSGFTQYVYRHAVGISIPRTSQEQFHSGQKVPLGRERAGDLVFFASYGSRSWPGHVGIYIGRGGKFIDYYSHGRPARVAYLSERFYGYVGARRYVQPVTVPARLVTYLTKIARKHHTLIARSFTNKGWDRWAVDFIPRRRKLYFWAKRNHLKAHIYPHKVRILWRP